MKNNGILVLAVFIFSHLSIFSQDTPIRAGKISKEELQMKVCELDSNANAMVICDYGKSYYRYADNKGFELCFDRLTRIKIFNNDGYKWADITIPLWKYGSKTEDITLLKAFTYNLEDGKIVKEKLKNSDIYTEEKNKNVILRKFSMPQVREGSVIEIEYTVVSDFFFSLSTWNFQNEIPVGWSEYITEIPEYYDYKRTLKGYVPLVINESSTKLEKVSLNTINRGDGKAQKTYFATESFSYTQYNERFVAKDVPAFIIEQPISSKDNYISKIDFELVSTKLPNRSIDYYTKSWDDINEFLLDYAEFGGQLKGGSYLKDIEESIQSLGLDDVGKMKKAYAEIQSRMKWNNRSSVTAYSTLRSALGEGSGNSADINLTLVLLLKRLGIESYPVILSTRSHGIVHPAQPALNAFNYVIALAIVDGQEYLLDATEPQLSFDMLPERTLNGQGRIVDKDKSGWVNLISDKKFKKISMFNLNLTDDFEMTGTIQNAYYDYAALDQRKEVMDFTSDDAYIEALQDENSGMHITKFELVNKIEFAESFKEKFEVVINDKIEGSEEISYFNPLFFDAITENPYKLEERKYPVEYAYPYESSTILNLIIPDGYEVDEFPESATVKLPENAASFIYTSNLVGNNLYVMSKININKTLFLPEEYEYLKEFYNYIINKQSEQVVISKQ